MPALLVLGVAGFLAVTTEMLPVGLLPAIGAGLGIDDSHTGWLVTVFAVMVAIFAVPLTWATRRCPRKPLLLATVVGYLISNVVIAVAPGFGLIVVGRVVGGLAHALFFSVCIGYVPSLVGPRQIGRGLAVVGGGTTAGFVLGVPLSTSLGTLLGWRDAFAVLAGVAAVVVLLLAWLLPAVGGAPAGRRLRKTGARTELGIVVGSNTLTFVGQYTMYTYISVVFLAAGARESWVGPLLLLCGACGLVGLAVVGRTVDRHLRATVLVVLSALAAALLAMGTVGGWLVGTVLVAALWCALFGGVPAMFQTSSVRAFTQAPEVAGAWINATANVGIALGALLGGRLVATSNATWYLAGIGAAFVALGWVVAAAGTRAFPRTTHG